MQLIAALSLLLTAQGHQTIITQDPGLSIDPKIMHSFIRCAHDCADDFNAWHKISNDTNSPLEAILVNKPFKGCIEVCKDTVEQQTGVRPELLEIGQIRKSKKLTPQQHKRKDKNRFNRSR